MSIYKYTIIKYLKSWSTWVVALISFALIFGLAGALAFSQFNPASPKAASRYAILSIAIVAGITSFLAVFTSVFAGFKSATMFKDEVEDGTFLVILSKPVSRSKIIMFKWLALFTMLILYTFLVALSFLITILIFDNGSEVANLSIIGVKIDTLTSSSPLISLIMWGILSVFALIFSSIALLFSTKLSVGATIGISIGLGVIIPITSLIEVFTIKAEYVPATDTNFLALNAISKKQKWSKDDLVNDPYSIYNVGFQTGDTDNFKKASLADINFQIQYLASYASDKTIPSGAKDYVSKSGLYSNAPGVKTGSYIPAKEQGYFAKDAEGTSDQKLIILKQQLEDAFKYTWEHSWIIRNQFINSSALLTALLEVEEGFTPDFNALNLPKDNDNDNAALKQGINPVLINELNDAVKTKKIDAVFRAISALTLFVEESLPDESLITPTNIKNQIYIMRLLDSVYNFVNKFSDNFIMKDISSNQKKTQQVLVTNEQPTVEDALLSLMFVALLENPMEAMNAASVNNFFNDQQVKISPDTKYDPTLKKVTDITNQGDAAIYLLNSKDAKATYRKIAILLDNGFVLKKIAYEEYLNKQWLLIAYLLIAFGLVPFTYLFIRRRDYR